MKKQIKSKKNRKDIPWMGVILLVLLIVLIITIIVLLGKMKTGNSEIKNIILQGKDAIVFVENSDNKEECY